MNLASPSFQATFPPAGSGGRPGRQQLGATAPAASPQLDPACPSPLLASPSTGSGSVPHPRHPVRPRGLSRVRSSGEPGRPLSPPSLGNAAGAADPPPPHPTSSPARTSPNYCSYRILYYLFHQQHPKMHEQHLAALFWTESQLRMRCNALLYGKLLWPLHSMRLDGVCSWGR